MNFQQLVEAYQELQETYNLTFEQQLVKQFKQHVFRALTSANRLDAYIQHQTVDIDFLVEQVKTTPRDFAEKLKREVEKEAYLSLELAIDPLDGSVTPCGCLRANPNKIHLTFRYLPNL